MIKTKDQTETLPQRKALPSWAWYVLCFALPALTVLLAYAYEGVYPFGDKSVLSYDMTRQYVELFRALKHGDALFSWFKAPGATYIGAFRYYVSSPLSLITLFFSDGAMPLGLMVLTLLKLSLAGLTFAIFARHYFGRLGLPTLLCALSYTLGTYCVTRSMCVMWPDGLIWLPLILLGLEWVMDGKRRWLFPLSLAVCFVCAWYISYMIGIFCCLWFIFRAVSRRLKGKELLRPVRDVLLSALWVLCLTAWLWLPALLSIRATPLDKAWHLLQRPGSFPFCYTFVISFLLCFLAQHILHRVADSFTLSRFGAVTLVALMCWDLGANATVALRAVNNFEDYQSYAGYQAYCRANATLVAAAKQDAQGETFYRIGDTHDRGLNSPLIFDYNGIAHDPGLYDQTGNDALSALGFAQTWYWCTYYGSTSFTDALFHVRYVITDRPVPGYTQLAQADNGLALWKNPHTLPLAFLPDAVPSGVDGISATAKQSLFFSVLTGDQDSLVAAVNGHSGGLFTPIEPWVESRDGDTVLTYYGNGQPIYLDLSADAVTDLCLDGRSLLCDPSHTGKTRSLHCLGAPATGEALTVTVCHNGVWDPAGLSAALDRELLAQRVDALNERVDVQEVTNSRIVLTAHADQDRTLVTTISAEDGWTAYVDGKKVEMGAWLNNTFLALELPAGSHQVTLRYTAPGLIPGVGLILLAVLAAGVAIYFHRGAHSLSPSPRGGKAFAGSAVTRPYGALVERCRKVIGALFASPHRLMSAGCVVLTLIMLFILRWAHHSLFHADGYGFLALYAAALYLLYRLTRRYAPLLTRRFAAVVGVAALVFFLGQLIFTDQLRYTPLWDVSAVFDGAVSWAVQGSLTDLVSGTVDGSTYFYYFPNNLGATGVLTLLFKLCIAWGISDFSRAATVLNALLLTATFATVALAGRRIAAITTGEDGCAWGVFFGAVFLVYPPFWFGAAVIYTDFLSILFPVLALWLCYEALAAEGKRRWSFYALAALAIGLGSLIRVTVAIVFFALVICLLLERKWLDAGALTALSLAAVLAFQLLLNLAVYPSQMDSDKKDAMATPVIHWVMMGLHPDGDGGGYNYDDETFTRSFHDPAERNAAIVGEIRARLEAMGVKGIRELAGRKSQVTFGDGTLLLDDILDDQPKTPGPLHDFLLTDGPHHEIYQKLCDAIFLIWLALAVILCVSGISKPLPARCYASVISVVGAAIFYLFWETRGRYITSFAPLILLSAMLGLMQLARRVEITKRQP